MGTYVRDALESDLLSGATLNAAGTTNGTAVEVAWPGHVQFILETGTVTGTTPTLVIEVKGCETSDFTTADVVTLGTISAGDNDNAIFAFETNVDARYVRAEVTVGGTAPVYTGSTLKVVPPDYLRERGAHPTAEALA